MNMGCCARKMLVSKHCFIWMPVTRLCENGPIPPHNIFFPLLTMATDAGMSKRERKAAAFKRQKSNVTEEPTQGAGAEKQGQAEAPADAHLSEVATPAAESSTGGADERMEETATEETAAPSKPTSADAGAKKPGSHKRKRESTATKTVVDESGGTSVTPVSKPSSTSSTSQKYIVFVGNMAFDVTADMLAKHLGQTCGEQPTVRLLTKKGDPSALNSLSNSKKKSVAKGKAQDPSAPTSKGCAFAEFSSAVALQKALRFHHTMFHGRQINVELTAGGGGKSKQRTDKIKQKNAALEKERRKFFEKRVKPEAEMHKQRQSEKASEPQAKPAKRRKEDEAPRKRAKVASGANAVALG